MPSCTFPALTARALACQRLVLIFLVAEASHCTFVLEQPQGSQDVLPFHPRLDWFINSVCYVSWCGMLILQKEWFTITWTYLPAPTSGLPGILLDDALWAECPKRTTVWSTCGDIIQKLVGASTVEYSKVYMSQMTAHLRTWDLFVKRIGKSALWRQRAHALDCPLESIYYIDSSTDPPYILRSIKAPTKTPAA